MAAPGPPGGKVGIGEGVGVDVSELLTEGGVGEEVRVGVGVKGGAGVGEVGKAVMGVDAGESTLIISGVDRAVSGNFISHALTSNTAAIGIRIAIRPKLGILLLPCEGP